jgi:Tfp pilus assembly protein FimV
MRSFAYCSLACACWLTYVSFGQSQDKKAEQPKNLTSNQALMRDKLAQVNRVLEGITLDDFEQVKESAQTLRMISRATSWHIVDQTPQYKRLVKNFQEQATDLERHAEERNVEAATLDLVRMNITCTHCHQHMREEADRRK